MRAPSPEDYARMSWAAREALVRPRIVQEVVREEVVHVTVVRAPKRPAPVRRWDALTEAALVDAAEVFARLSADDPQVCLWRLEAATEEFYRARD